MKNNFHKTLWNNPNDPPNKTKPTTEKISDTKITIDCQKKITLQKKYGCLTPTLIPSCGFLLI